MSEELGPGLAGFAASTDFLAGQIVEHQNEDTVFSHDRSETVGGSEIDACPRKVKDSKLHDRRWAGNGYTARGKGMEAAMCDTFRRIERYWRVVKQRDLYFTSIGDRQETMVLSEMGASATPDGFLTIDGETIYLEIKSVDPRISGKSLPKSGHVAQCQYGMELCHRTGRAKPQRAFLIYQDASDWARVQIFEIQRDEAAASALLKRAKKIMSAKSPMDLEPMGLESGGAECSGCPLENTCKAERAARVTDYRDDARFDEAVIAELDDLARQRMSAVLAEAEAKATKDAMSAQIRNILEEHNASIAATAGYSIRLSVRAGAKRFDRSAAEADGLDLEPYYKQGNGFPVLTIRENE